MGSDRWALVEYGAPRKLVGEIAARSGLGLDQVKGLLLNAGDRIATSLGMAASPISVNGEYVRAIDIAGILKLGPGIEIEVAPKFLGNEETGTRWREDFFYLANLSRHGKILSSERLHAGRTASRDLPSLVSQSAIELHRDNRRRPLRTYGHFDECDFTIDGDVDPESIALPSSDGFEQSTIRYTRRNVFNATIKASMSLLQGEVSSTRLRMQLSRVSAELGPQAAVRSPRHTVLPSRARRWQELFDLSVDVLQGLGLSFDPNWPAHSPGYVVNTWRVWEDFVMIASRIAFGSSQVRTQIPFTLGRRTRLSGGTEAKSFVSVIPDISLQLCEPEAGSLLLDAKYRTRAEARIQRIAEADIYESLAFARASKTNTIALLYPAVSTIEAPAQLGSVFPFETIHIDEVTIYGLQVEARGISGADGLRRFSAAMRQGLRQAVTATDG